MNATTKVLIVIVAALAFGIGWVMNSARVEANVSTDVLLAAELIETESPRTTSRVQDKLKDVTLVNFWASWCAPCREEMPMFETMFRQHQGAGFQIVGVAIDAPSKTQAMLDSMDISYPILYAERTGMQIMDSVGNPNGLLPYTLLLDENGTVLEQKVGTVHAEDVMGWLEAHL